jgi:hypothetical protein
MSAAEVEDMLGYAGNVIEAFDDRAEHLHEFFSLLRHVLGEDVPQLRREGEKLVIKNAAGFMRLPADEAETVANDFHLRWRHGRTDHENITGVLR